MDPWPVAGRYYLDVNLTIAVVLAVSGSALLSVVADLIRRFWSASRSSNITIEIGGDKIELSAVNRADAEMLIAAFLEGNVQTLRNYGPTGPIDKVSDPDEATP
jgi:hypothetical protein